MIDCSRSNDKAMLALDSSIRVKAWPERATALLLIRQLPIFSRRQEAMARLARESPLVVDLSSLAAS